MAEVKYQRWDFINDCEYINADMVHKCQMAKAINNGRGKGSISVNAEARPGDAGAVPAASTIGGEI